MEMEQLEGRVAALEARVETLEEIVQGIPESINQWRESQDDFTKVLEKLKADQDRADFWREGGSDNGE